ncbi:hypothetical protein [Nocardia caishijiensis]|uniref:Phage tail protein n=1 Tax=Nocardia caishijiensis TaxID=184756 RepID=A0ABQ6YTZ9_9NOCA|nr:hypothetical protein [Nocardia caishijiensis]KAF0849285.1 hypothetical protein FNL39_101723 [Nocardia caishijiensis]
MSRFAEVIVIARDGWSAMEPLTQPDPGREWHQCFTPVDDSVFEGTLSGSVDCYMWVAQFPRMNWWGLLSFLEGLEWADPYSVQVLIRDEEDSCFGLWMLIGGKMTEIPLAGTTRLPADNLITGGVLIRSEKYGEEPSGQD